MVKSNLAPKSVIKKKLSFGKLIRMVLDFFMNITESLGAVLLAVMTLVITWQVITRFKILHINSPWTEEIALIMLVWFGLTGAGIGIRKETHMGVEFVTSLFPVKVQRILTIIVSLIMIAFSIFLFIEGIALAQGTWNDQLAATLLPRGVFVYLAVPTASFLMTIYSLELIFKQFRPGGGNK